MKGENRPLVTDEPVKFEKQPVEVQDFFWKIPDCFRGFHGTYLKSIKKHRNMLTHHWWDLGTLGSRQGAPGTVREEPAVSCR